jgi:hypothetical protein
MCKLLVVQRYSNVLDEQTEYQVSDLPVRGRTQTGRLSVQRFVGYTVVDKVPDAHTLWDSREALVSAGVFEQPCEAIAQQRQARHTEFSFAKPRAAG